ncbi:hypothetical protein JHK87_011701 [Glycine soja]|nr:hypothetical protein JHK87_011701 [Glycine soja]
MVSTRRSGSVSAKRSSSSEDKPPSPKRQKVDNGGSSEKPVPTPAENSKDLSTPEPVLDPGECGSGEAQIAGAVADDGVSSGKRDATPAVPVTAPIADAACPSFSSWINYQKQNPNIEGAPWCRFLSQSAQNPNVAICTPNFTIGSNRGCNFPLNDQTISGNLCRIKHTQGDGSAVAVLESMGSKGSVLVNGTHVKRNTSCVLTSGDEVVFGVLGNHSYIFQQLNTEVAVRGAEAQSGIGKFLPLERRSRDPSAVDGASILASLSNRQDLTRWKSPSQTSSKPHQGTDVSSRTVHHNCTETELDGSESTPNVRSDKAADVQTSDNNSTMDCNPDAGAEAGNAKIYGVNDFLRPFFRNLARPSCKLKLSKSICKQVLEERNGTLDMQAASTLGTSVRCAVFKEDVNAAILDGKEIDVSFDNFPYYLSENTKNVLVAACFMHLMHKEHEKFTADLTTINPRILLSGPAGSEIYQEMLVKALAKYFGAKLLIFDSHLLLGGLSSKEAELLKDGLNAEKSFRCTKLSPTEDMARIMDPLASETETPSPSNAPTSYGFESQPKLETDNTPSTSGTAKSCSFKLGDRVKFSCSSSCGVYQTSPRLQCPLLLDLNDTISNLSAVHTSVADCRGPSNGSRGKVVLLFDDNPLSKIGVRFDKPIPDGVDLGGACEGGQGFFCNVTDLRLESSAVEELDKLLIHSLFEVVFSESRSAPFILFMKDAEKSIVGNGDSHSFKSKLENLPDNVVVIGSHTQNDSRKEKHPGATRPCGPAIPLLFGAIDKYRLLVAMHIKALEALNLNSLLQDTLEIFSHPGGLLFTKFGSNQTALLDLAFPVLGRCGMECEGLETLCIKDQTLTNENAEKIIGWALSHHLMQNSEAKPDSKLVLSCESIQYGIGILQSIQNESKSLKKSLKDVVTENEFEKRLLADVIPPSDIDVTFDDIGALEKVKDTLKELERAAALAEGQPAPALCSSGDVRSLNMEDFKYAHQQPPSPEACTFVVLLMFIASKGLLLSHFVSKMKYRFLFIATFITFGMMGFERS